MKKICQPFSRPGAERRGWIPRVNLRLDRAIVASHRLLPGRYHPYFLAEDLGALSSIAVGFAFQAAFGVLRGWIHAVAIGVTFVLYLALYLRLKLRLTGVGARSAMQDSLVFVAPLYIGLSVALGQKLHAALDVLAFSLLLAIGCMRIGCFIGGCCHGKPARLGVLYMPGVLRSSTGLRLFTPGPCTGTRVFPLQLAESAYLFLIAAILWVREGTLASPDGSTLALAVMAYSGWRFVCEFFRGHRHRPKHFGLSEAQLLSTVLAIVGAGVLFVI
jgi:phosphatidylglycerol:prolipoprotein diacylglycerol transferase